MSLCRYSFESMLMRDAADGCGAVGLRSWGVSESWNMRCDGNRQLTMNDYCYMVVYDCTLTRSPIFRNIFTLLLDLFDESCM